MATAADNLTTAAANVAALIAQVTASPKPTYSIDGVSYSWESYVAMLVSQHRALLQALQDVSSPFEVRSYGV